MLPPHSQYSLLYRFTSSGARPGNACVSRMTLPSPSSTPRSGTAASAFRVRRGRSLYTRPSASRSCSARGTRSFVTLARRRSVPRARAFCDGPRPSWGPPSPPRPRSTGAGPSTCTRREMERLFGTPAPLPPSGCETRPPTSSPLSSSRGRLCGRESCPLRCGRPGDVEEAAPPERPL